MTVGDVNNDDYAYPYKHYTFPHTAIWSDDNNVVYCWGGGDVYT